MKTQKTTDAVAILHKRYVEGDQEMEVLLKTERIHAEVAAQLYQIRIESGLSQRELAKKVGTSASVICRLENADYEGHSLAMLRRIAAALHKQIRISFHPLQETVSSR
ncbi:MAG: helix-turn-helix transcriptional regulator [Gemmatimonadetes bacterium]|nr:helix-turn-helix transcriptional regulator [Gemmatimonadota bacterium]